MNNEENPHVEKNPSPTSQILPTNSELTIYSLKTCKHSINFHYFASSLGIGNNDPDMPHDLYGKRNRLEWEVVKGLALSLRLGEVEQSYFDKVLKPLINESVELHREQYHHKKWNGNTPNPNASDEDMYVGALDTICALLEPRKYNGGSHNYEQILKIVDGFPEHKGKYCRELIPEMRKLPQPRLDFIKDLICFPNIGLNQDIYNQISDVVMAGVQELRERGYSIHGTGLRPVLKRRKALLV